jgi:hypothetical protein
LTIKFTLDTEYVVASAPHRNIGFCDGVATCVAHQYSIVKDREGAQPSALNFQSLN